MNQLNQLILKGTISSEIECTELPTLGKRAQFPVAVKRNYKNLNGENETEICYFDIECYGSIADFMTKQNWEGREIRIVGRLTQKTWKDEEGKFNSKVYVVADHIEFEGAKPKEVLF